MPSSAEGPADRRWSARDCAEASDAMGGLRSNSVGQSELSSLIVVDIAAIYPRPVLAIEIANRCVIPPRSVFDNSSAALVSPRRRARPGTWAPGERNDKVGRMHVSRIGFAPIKGGRHRTYESVSLTRTGPVGDRAFCLIDPEVGRCVRTVENPTLLQTRASWDGVVLSVQLPSGTVVGKPAAVGEAGKVDYWGRSATVEHVEGPWAAAYSAYLGREVVLAACTPGEVVYGAPVSLVTSGSLARLADEVGAPCAGVRFRATFELDTGELPSHAEDSWTDLRLRLGTAEIRVRRVIPRCAVIDLNPASGVKDLDLMKALGRYRRTHGEVGFGVDAFVTVPGRVRSGDSVMVAPG